LLDPGGVGRTELLVRERAELRLDEDVCLADGLVEGPSRPPFVVAGRSLT
jgi:hypothetical protein